MATSVHDKMFWLQNEANFAYDLRLEKIRQLEFDRLKDSTYLDHVGTTLYAKSQIESYHKDLLSNVYGNPHSGNYSSKLTADTIDQIRYRVLGHFNATPDDYHVIFTSGCTGALKLLAETFDLGSGDVSGRDRGGLERAGSGASDRCAVRDISLAPSAVPSEAAIITDPHLAKLPRAACEQAINPNDVRQLPREIGQRSRSLSPNNNGVRLQENPIEQSAAAAEKFQTQSILPSSTSNEINGNLQSENYKLPQYNYCKQNGCHGNKEGHNNQSAPFVGGEKDNKKVGMFCFLESNHTSVVGMREIVAERGGSIICLNENEILQQLDGNPMEETMAFKDNALFAYPAQCNFSGRKYPLEWISAVQQGMLGRTEEGSRRRWYVLLDAASYVTTSPLDLKKHTPDFLTISFYKMFGFPTGLGALLVRADSACLLKKRYFGGGTVQVSVSKERFHIDKDNISDRFEDGTLPFLDIIALRHGFDTLERLAGPMKKVAEHTFLLARFVHHQLLSLRHGNGAPVAKIYSEMDYEDRELQGAIVNFNLLRAGGEFVGYAEVDKLAQLHGIHLRTGCFCNMGACQKYMNMTTQQIKKNFQAGHVCGDNVDVIDGQPTGSVRVSFGYMSTMLDAQFLLAFITDCFLEGCPKTQRFLTRSSIQQPLLTDTPTLEVSSHPNDLMKVKVAGQSPVTSELARSQGGIDLTNSSDGTLSGRPRLGVDSDPRDLMEVKVTEHSLLPRAPVTFDLAGHGDMVLTNIMLYPVKSCGAFEVLEWELSSKGLLYDREWMIVNESGACLSQKRVPGLCLIKPYINLNNQQLTLTYPGISSLDVPLMPTALCTGEEEQVYQSKVCGDRVEAKDCGRTVTSWLSQALGISGCRLLRQTGNSTRTMKLTAQVETSGGKGKKQDNGGLRHKESLPSHNTSDGQAYTNNKEVLPPGGEIMNQNVNGDRNDILTLPPGNIVNHAMKEKVPPGGQNRNQASLSLANESQFLLLNRASCVDLYRRITKATVTKETDEEECRKGVDDFISRFRGNFVVSGTEPYMEDHWSAVAIGNQHFMSQGPCTRCQMVCVNQGTGERSKEPFMTLATYRGKKVSFGIHLSQRERLAVSGTVVRVGDRVIHHS